MENKIDKILYWAPRILSILFICFLMLFSLDVFSTESSFWQIVVGLFMHNIPALLLLVVLLISWKYEIVGGIGFILAGLLYIYLVFSGGFEWFKISWILTISGPAILTGILFIISWFKNKNN